MSDLIFSLNATMPIFFTMMFGWFLKKMGLMNETFIGYLNKFVFNAALPVLLFKDLGTVDFFEVWDTKFVVFCFLATLVSIGGAAALSFVWKDKSVQGEFIQGCYRSSSAIMGIAFIQNIYGNAGMGPLMIFATVPLYNAMAVVILSVMKPEREPLNRKLMKKTVKGIITNPIILGIGAGMLWSLLKFPMPFILDKTTQNIGCLATPLGLMAMGGSFEFEQITDHVAETLSAVGIKLVALVAVFLPLAVKIGFSGEKLIAILVMLGSATTVSSFIMAKNMGHKGVLTSSIVMLTTLGSAFTLTLWLFILKNLALI